MANEQLPDWCREGETAYVVVSHYDTGVGGYPTTVRVVIERITSLYIVARLHRETVSDAPRKFRRKDLVAVSQGAKCSSAARLAGPDDRDVHRAAQLAAVMSALPGGDMMWAKSLRVIERVSRANLAQGPADNLDVLLQALRYVRDTTDVAIAKIRTVREQL